MSDKPRNYQRELINIANELADSVTEMTDEEVRAELSEWGDPTPSVKGILRQAAKAYRQRTLLAAQQRYEESAAAFGQQQFDLPTTAAAQREMLNLLIASNPVLSAQLTAHGRDFKEVADSDLPDLLKQLLGLGLVLPARNEGEGQS